MKVKFDALVSGGAQVEPRAYTCCRCGVVVPPGRMTTCSEGGNWVLLLPARSCETTWKS